MAATFHPPFSFRSCRKENGPWTVQKKRTLRRVGPRRARTSSRRRGKVGPPSFRLHQTRCSWGIFWPGEGPDIFPSSFRWRWPGGKRGPTRASAPTGRYEGRACVFARSPSSRHPCRGGCPHPPVSRPPSTTKQSASGLRRAVLSTSTPRSVPDWHTRGQSNANAPVRRVAAEDCPSFVGNDSEDPRFKQTCTQVQVLR